MSIASLSHVLGQLGAEGGAAAAGPALSHETLLMTLARATRADTHVAGVEVEAVRREILAVTGQDLTEADIRIAASSALFETTPLESALAKLRPQLTSKDRAQVVKSLAAVIRSDTRISEFELDYFDSVAKALEIRPSELAGLT